MSFVELGYVARAHGLAGDVGLRVHWEFTPALRPGAVVNARKEGASKELRVTTVRGSGPTRVAHFAGVDTRDAADALRGYVIEIPREKLPALEAGSYYLCDVVGAVVHTPDGVVGRVLSVIAYPAADAMVIELIDGTRVEQVLEAPWLDAVDIPERVVRLTTTDGFI